VNTARFMEEMNIHGGREAIASYIEKEVEDRLRGMPLREGGPGPVLIVDEFDTDHKTEVACCPGILFENLNGLFHDRPLSEIIDRLVERACVSLKRQIQNGYSDREEDLRMTSITVIPGDSPPKIGPDGSEETPGRFQYVIYTVLDVDSKRK